MEHPRLRIIVRFFLNQLLIEKRCRTFDHVGLYVDAALPRQSHAPKNVCRHEVIALANFPPAPTAIGMLKIIETVETLPRYFSKFSEISAALRMRGRCSCFLDATEDLFHCGLWFQTEVSQGFRSDRRGQKSAHRLFSAPVRIVYEIRQCVEHGRRHAGRDLNGEFG